MPSVDLNYWAAFEDVISWDMPALATTAGQTTYYLSKTFDGIYEVVDAAFISSVVVTANDTNNATVTVNKHDGIGGAGVLVASFQTNVAGGSIADGVPKQLVVTPTLVNRQLSVPNLLAVVVAKTGSITIGPGRLVITLRLRDPV